MTYEEAIREMVKLIQSGDKYIEQYELMLMEFIKRQEDGDTVRMSFEFAVNEIK